MADVQANINPEPVKKKGGKGWIIALIVVLIACVCLVCGCVGGLYLLGKANSPTEYSKKIDPGFQSVQAQVAKVKSSISTDYAFKEDPANPRTTAETEVQINNAYQLASDLDTKVTQAEKDIPAIAVDEVKTLDQKIKTYYKSAHELAKLYKNVCQSIKDILPIYVDQEKAVADLKNIGNPTTAAEYKVVSDKVAEDIVKFTDHQKTIDNAPALEGAEYIKISTSKGIKLFTNVLEDFKTLVDKNAIAVAKNDNAAATAAYDEYQISRADLDKDITTNNDYTETERAKVITKLNTYVDDLESMAPEIQSEYQSFLQTSK